MITSFHAHYQGLDRNSSAYRLVQQIVHVLVVLAVQADSISNSERKCFWRQLLSSSPTHKGAEMFISVWQQSTLQLNLVKLYFPSNLSKSQLYLRLTSDNMGLNALLSIMDQQNPQWHEWRSSKQVTRCTDGLIGLRNCYLWTFTGIRK